MAILFTATSSSGSSSAFIRHHRGCNNNIQAIQEALEYKNNMTKRRRYRLVRYTTISQLVLAFVVLLFMAKIWFSPPKLELSRQEWQSFIDNYDYSWHGIHRYDEAYDDNHHGRRIYYTNPFDRLQQTLRCCGFRSPNEWLTSSSTSSGSSKPPLLAPSCCSNPAIVGASDIREIILGPTTKAAAQLMTQPGRRWIHYCASLDEATMRIDSNGLEIPVGCQQRLAERDSRFLFSLRMRLLLLLSALFLMVQASLTFYLPSIEPAPSSSGAPPNSSQRGLEESADNVAINRQQLPPDYWRALHRADVVLVVDKQRASRSEPPKQIEMHCFSPEAPEKNEPRSVVANQ